MPAEKENRRNELLLKLFLGATTIKEEMIKQLALHQQKVLKTKKEFKNIQTNVLSEIADEHPNKSFLFVAEINIGFKVPVGVAR